MMKFTAIAVALIVLVSGCREGNAKFERPPRKEALEYDCLKHAKDGICEVPWKDKIVLYCVKGKIKRVVRDRDDC